MANKLIAPAIGREIEITDGDWQEIREILPTATEGQLTVVTPQGVHAIWELDHRVR